MKLVFELVSIHGTPVKIGDQYYLVREASCEAARRYRNGVLEGLRFDANGKPTQVTGLANIEPQLLSDCLFHAKWREGIVPDHEPTADELECVGPVSKSEVLNLPSRIVTPLVDYVKKISGLSEEENETLDEVKERRNELDKKISELEETGSKN